MRRDALLYERQRPGWWASQHRGAAVSR